MQNFFCSQAFVFHGNRTLRRTLVRSVMLSAENKSINLLKLRKEQSAQECDATYDAQRFYCPVNNKETIPAS